jgi:hypothetical protein
VQAFVSPPQNLAEFYATVTNPRRVTQPKTPTEALDAIDGFLGLPGLVLLQPPPDWIVRWVHLLRLFPAKGPNAFDALLVATMQGNGVN